MNQSPADSVPVASSPPIRLAIAADYAEEGWASMDLIAEMMFAYLQSDHQAEIAAAAKMATTGTAVIAGALVWVVINVGSLVLDRFGTLVKEDQGQLYQKYPRHVCSKYIYAHNI